MSQIEIDGGAVAYTTIPGAAALPHLIFLHEGLGCIAMWGDFPQRLCAATGCPGLVYDRLGYGQSGPLLRQRDTHYLHAAARTDLPQIIERLLPPNATFILFGHSDGGSIALLFGAAQSEQSARLRGIVTEAAHVFVETVTLAGIRDAVTAYDSGKLAGLSRYHGAKADDVFRGWSDAWLSPVFAAWNIESELPRIEVPLLVVQGEGDQYGTPRQVHAIAAQARGPATVALLPNCGHTPHKESADEVIALTAEFVRSVVASAEA
jgi:pimeloyl-ACP methyl ester carboxylesterase